MQDIKNEVLNLINNFQIVPKAAVASYLNDIQTAGQIISNLVKNRKIATDEDTCFSHITLIPKKNELEFMQRILWLYVDLNKIYNITNYVILDDKFIRFTFEAGHELYDVVYVSLGSETDINNIVSMKERYLPPKDKEELKRIVLIDDKSQIKNIQINGTLFYTIVSPDGEITYIKPN